MSVKPAFVLVAALLCSCSVWQDREGCPCWLDLAVQGGAESIAEVRLFNTRASACSVQLEDSRYDGQIVIPRESCRMAVYSGQHEDLLRDGILTIPDGGQMDEIYAGAADVLAEGESASAEVRLHKQYAALHLTFVSADRKPYPYEVCLKGNVSGLDLHTLEPVQGSFRYHVEAVLGTYYRICLPRQVDDSLTVEIDSHPVPLGRKIREAGYDWTSEDLDDIYMELDCALASVSLRIVPWTEEVLERLVI